MTMQADDIQDCPKCKKGLPAWMATFADLMALLLSFFVLLLSFSEIDALRFQRMAGNMRNAFGVQNVVQADSVPRGTSIIAQEFSPGRPEPTPLNVVTQDTTRNLESTLEVNTQDEIQQQETEQGTQGELTRDLVVTQEARELQEQAAELAGRLGEYLENGALQIETVNESIVIRVREQSFPSGSARLADEYLPALDRVREVLVSTPGQIRVEGHTDATPAGDVSSGNWQLSFARALAVAKYLWAAREMDENRFTVVGHGPSKPLVSNASAQGRAENRRVEIVIQRDNPDYEGERVPREAQGDDLDFGDPSLFELDSDEIF